MKSICTLSKILVSSCEHYGTSHSLFSLLLEGERWKQADVPVEIQGLVNALEMGVVVGGQESSSDHPPSGLPPTKFLLIHGSNFAVVG